MRWLRFYGALIVACFALTSSIAGTACNDAPPSPIAIMRGLELAQKSKDSLDASGAKVVFIARVGQDLSKYNLRYSHLGIAFLNNENRWDVLHELNDCGTANSHLFNHGLGNFFIDDLFAFDSLILVPSDQIQQKLLAQINQHTAPSFYEAHYNMLAFPFSTKYQNSNQWALEFATTALSNDVKITNRTQAQNWLKAVGYSPSTLSIPTFTRLGARLFKANVAFDDHPFDRRMAGLIDVVTVESIQHFLSQRDPQMSSFVISYQP